jgi:hypothetical protein
MRKKAEIRICDECGKNVSDGGEMRIGGSVFSGWWHLTKTNGSTCLSALQEQKEFDVCSIDCAIKRLTKLKKSIN